MKPNFIFIGPDKTGSSWMYEILRQNPYCYVPACKDIYFFDRYYDRGLGWYLSFFREPGFETKAVGELSHDYLFSPVAARRIKQDLPDVKLLTCLRHPVERTFSHYLFMIRSGRTQDSFETALSHFPELINNSLYYKHLVEYFKIFSDSQIKVLFFQDLQQDSKRFAEEIFDFLGIPFVEDIDYSQQVLSASKPRSFLLARMAKMGANFARDLSLTSWVGAIKRSPFANLLYKPYQPAEKPRVSTSTALYLIDVFQDDILKLQDLLRRDLSEWLAFES